MALLTTTEVMKKKSFGNYVLIAASTLDEAALGRRAAASDFPTAFVRAGETAAWARSAKPIADPDEDPAPPPETSGTLRFR